MMHFVAALAIAVAVPQEKPVNPTAAALYDFSERLNAYLKLREDLGHKLEPLARTPSASRLSRRSRRSTSIRTSMATVCRMHGS